RYNPQFTATRSSCQSLVINSIHSPVATLASHATTVSSTSVTGVNSPLMLNVLSCPPLLYIKLTSAPYVKVGGPIIAMLVGTVIIAHSDVILANSSYAMIVFCSLQPSSIDGIDIPSFLAILLSLTISTSSIVNFARMK
ncbi:unnamed protein product, partial [Ilex paraguariensis]